MLVRSKEIHQRKKGLAKPLVVVQKPKVILLTTIIRRKYCEGTIAVKNINEIGCLEQLYQDAQRTCASCNFCDTVGLFPRTAPTASPKLTVFGWLLILGLDVGGTKG